MRTKPPGGISLDKPGYAKRTTEDTKGTAPTLTSWWALSKGSELYRYMVQVVPLEFGEPAPARIIDRKPVRIRSVQGHSGAEVNQAAQEAGRYEILPADGVSLFFHGSEHESMRHVINNKEGLVAGGTRGAEARQEIYRVVNDPTGTCNDMAEANLHASAFEEITETYCPQKFVYKEYKFKSGIAYVVDAQRCMQMYGLRCYQTITHALLTCGPISFDCIIGCIEVRTNTWLHANPECCAAAVDNWLRVSDAKSISDRFRERFH